MPCGRTWYLPTTYSYIPTKLSAKDVRDLDCYCWGMLTGKDGIAFAKLTNQASQWRLLYHQTQLILSWKKGDIAYYAGSDIRWLLIDWAEVWPGWNVYGDRCTDAPFLYSGACHLLESPQAGGLHWCTSSLFGCPKPTPQQVKWAASIMISANSVNKLFMNLKN